MVGVLDNTREDIKLSVNVFVALAKVGVVLSDCRCTDLRRIGSAAKLAISLLEMSLTLLAGATPLCV